MPSRKAQRRNPRPVQQERTTVTAKELLEMGMAPYPNRGLEQPDREGVYAHSFKCRNCALEFVLFSWQATERVLSLATPETAWTDAIAKLPKDPRAVVTPRGSEALEPSCPQSRIQTLGAVERAQHKAVVPSP